MVNNVRLDVLWIQYRLFDSIFYRNNVCAWQRPWGMFWCLGSPLLISNSRTSPHGLILVFGHLPSPLPYFQTPERALVGAFWCSGTSSPHLEPCLSLQTTERTLVGVFCCSGIPCLEQQKHVLCGVFLMSGTHTPLPVLFGMPPTLPLISNTSDLPR